MKPRLLISLLAFILIAGPVLSAQSGPASLVLTTGFFDELTVFFLACGPFVILAAACALWYGHALKKGRRFKFVDFLAGLFQMGAIAALYVAYGEATGKIFSLTSLYGSRCPISGCLSSGVCGFFCFLPYGHCLSVLYSRLAPIGCCIWSRSCFSVS